MALPMSCRNAARVATWRVEPELLGHDAGQERDFLRVVQDVLAVAGAELQAPHQPQHLGMEVVEPELEGGRLAFRRTVSSMSTLTFSTTSSIRAGWMRPSAISRSIAWRAISRRSGSKLERMMAPGVSSTISSTPVAVSSARMLRPSRPMIRPLRSSLGRSTTETVVSMACSAALRWMASAMICCARTAAVSRASVSRRLTRLAASRRASPSSCLQQQLARLVGAQAGDALQLALALGDQLLAARRARPSPLLRCAASARSRRAEILLEPVGRGQAVGEGARLVGERLFEREHLLAPLARLRCSASAAMVVRLFACLERGFLAQRCRRRARPVSGAPGC